MNDLYDTDIALWSEHQAALLRRRADGELVNDADFDWSNIAEEIADVGKSELNATLSQIDNILRHRLCLLGWPDAPAAGKWQAELREFHRQIHRHFTPSMTGGANPKISKATIAEAYAAAVDHCLAHMDTAPTQPLPAVCPWSLCDVLAAP